MPIDRNAGGVADQLAEYGKSSVYFDPLGGNHGDKLIEMGSRLAIEAAGVSTVGSPESASVVVMNGGGAMNAAHSGGFDRLRYYSQAFPDKPLVVLPSSVDPQAADIAELVAPRTAPLVFFARELPTYEKLQQIAFPCPASIGLDHDMAFRLEDSGYVQTLRSRVGEKHVLIVERGDRESTTSAAGSNTRRSVTYFIPKSIKYPLKRVLARRRAKGRALHTAFAEEGLALVREQNPALGNYPVIAADISRADVCSFERFGRLIAESAVIVTTRMHVAILGSMLSKQVLLKRGSYHKFQGVYDYSLKHRCVRVLA